MAIKKSNLSKSIKIKNKSKTTPKSVRKNTKDVRKRIEQQGSSSFRFLLVSILVFCVISSGLIYVIRNKWFNASAATKNQKIVIFGDSIVYGYATPVKRWTDIVQANLKKDAIFKNVVVINKSFPGQTIITDNNYITDSRGIKIGGVLYKYVLETYPRSTNKSLLPSTVVLVPSINEFNSSKEPTTEKKVEFAVSGLIMIKQYLLNLGVKNVYITSMLESSKAWDDNTPIDMNATIKLFNKKLKEKNLMSTDAISLDFDNKIGSDPAFFINTDQLHPNQSGHDVMAKRMTSFFKLNLK